MQLIKKFIDLILYGNFWIALGGLALTMQSHYIFNQSLELNTLSCFVFFATWLLYALHRIVGILRLKDFLDIERYSVIARFRHHIIVYAIIAGIGTFWYFFQLARPVQIALFIPGFFSLAYVFPFFGKKRRLRDFNQIKIYLVALVWAWVTVVLPVVDSGLYLSWSLIALFVERALFVFAITLPFDIRDLRVDGHSSVATIPGVLGIQQSVNLALGLLLLAGLCVGISFYLGLYTLPITLLLLFSYLLTALFLSRSNPERHDYFFSGLLDGTMVLQGALIYALGYYLSL